jgi:hypothetical protein
MHEAKSHEMKPQKPAHEVPPLGRFSLTRMLKGISLDVKTAWRPEFELRAISQLNR